MDRCLYSASDLIMAQRKTPEIDTPQSTIEKIIVNLIDGWKEGPHSSMELLVCAAEAYPLPIANRIVREVVSNWKVRDDYSWSAGGSADHCYLAALCLTANSDLADTDLVVKCKKTVLSIYSDKDESRRQRSVDLESKTKFLNEYLVNGLLLNLDDIYEASSFLETCQVIIPDFEQINSELIAYLAVHPEYLEVLHWRKFEELLEAIFRNQGYMTELGPGSGDGGVDLRLIQKDSIGKLLTLVQAKRYKAENAIDLQAVQALYGVVDDQKAHRGLFVTTSKYQPCARNFADRQNGRIILATSKEVADWCKAVSR